MNALIMLNTHTGAMYSFPRITLPAAFLAEAKQLGKAPDVLYCLQLLDETGLSCVPGSGFRQAEGTFHIRTTILVRPALLLNVQYETMTSLTFLFGVNFPMCSPRRTSSRISSAGLLPSTRAS